MVGYRNRRNFFDPGAIEAHHGMTDRLCARRGAAQQASLLRPTKAAGLPAQSGCLERSKRGGSIAAISSLVTFFLTCSSSFSMRLM